MQFPDFHEFESYLREVEPELTRLVSNQHVYRLEDSTPESISALVSDVAAKTLAAANKMTTGYLAAYHQFLADYFESQESDG